MHTRAHAFTHAHMFTCTCTCAHKYARIGTHMYKHARAHTHRCAHTHAHTPPAVLPALRRGAPKWLPRRGRRFSAAARGSHRGAGKSYEKRGPVAFGEGGWVMPSASKVNARRNETRVFQVGLQTATGTGTLRFTLLRDLRRCGLSAYQRCDGGVGIRGAGSFLSVWGRSNKNEGRCSGGTAHRERR